MSLRSSATSVLPLGALSLAALGLALAACGGGTSTATTKDAGSTAMTPDVATIIILPKRDAGVDAPSPASDAGHDVTVGPPDTGPADAGVDVPKQPPPPTDAQANHFPALKPPVPQVEYFGGPVLTNPVFIPVIFAGDVYAPQIPGFVDALGGSDYWKGAVGEYGVGKGTSVAPIILNETMPSGIDDTQIQVWLQNRIGSDPRFLALPAAPDAGHGGHDAGRDAGSRDAGRSDAARDASPSDGGHGDRGADAALDGTADAGVDAGDSFGVSLDASAPLSGDLSTDATPPPQAIYVVFMPEGTTVTLVNQTSCVNGGFGGYHSSTPYTPNGQDIVYAVIPRCASFNGLSGFDIVTGALSHELAEASTDPNPGTNAAYARVDLDHLIWQEVIGGGEIGDLCAVMPGAYFTPPEASLSSYIVQRMWSNAHATAGHDPCQPALPASQEPFYFNSAPKFGTVGYPFGAQSFPTLGVVAPPETPTTIELDLFSDKSTEGMTWTVTAYSPYTGAPTPDLEFSPTKFTGSNGDKVNITVTNHNSDGQLVHPFFVQSTIGELQNLWVGLVVNQ